MNKTTAFVLLHILGLSDTAGKISQQLPQVDIRSIQRSLVRLVAIGLLNRHGVNNPNYSVNYEELAKADIADSLLEDDKRPGTRFNHELITWLGALPDKQLDTLYSNYAPNKLTKPFAPMSAKELEYLTVELSWKSSSLEGNTYTLLDTQLLLLEGIKARDKTDFETQMILNHKNALIFIVDHKELFVGDIEFRTLEELHRIIGFNLGIDAGVRKKPVRITASNYEPLVSPHQLRENADVILAIISRASNPFSKAFLAMAFIPYLQVFEDGNKRTGRMLANALLINLVGRGFSLRKTEPKQLAIAYLSFYEFNSTYALSKILQGEFSQVRK